MSHLGLLQSRNFTMQLVGAPALSLSHRAYLGDLEPFYVESHHKALPACWPICTEPPQQNCFLPLHTFHYILLTSIRPKYEYLFLVVVQIIIGAAVKAIFVTQDVDRQLALVAVLRLLGVSGGVATRLVLSR